MADRIRPVRLRLARALMLAAKVAAPIAFRGQGERAEVLVVGDDVLIAASTALRFVDQLPDALVAAAERG